MFWQIAAAWLSRGSASAGGAADEDAAGDDIPGDGKEKGVGKAVEAV